MFMLQPWTDLIQLIKGRSSRLDNISTPHYLFIYLQCLTISAHGLMKTELKLETTTYSTEWCEFRDVSPEISCGKLPKIYSNLYSQIFTVNFLPV